MIGPTLSILARLRRLDIRLAVQDDKLTVDAPRGAMTPELTERIKSHKAELLTILAGRTPETPSERDTTPAIVTSDDKTDAATWPNERPGWVEDVMADLGPGCPMAHTASSPVETPDGWTPTR